MRGTSALPERQVAESVASPILPGRVTKTWLQRAARPRWDCCGGHRPGRAWALQVHYELPGGEGGRWFFDRSKRKLKRLQAQLGGR